MKKAIVAFAICLVMTSFLASPAPAAALDEIAYIRGKVLDADTGEPPVNVSWALYRHQNGEWGLAHDGEVGAGGTIDTMVCPAGTFVLYLDGHSGYEDSLYRSTEPTYELDTSNASIPYPTRLPYETFAHATKIVTKHGDHITLPTDYIRPKPTPYGCISGTVSSRFAGWPISQGFVRVYRWDAVKAAWVPYAFGMQPGWGGEYNFIGTAASPLIGDFRVGFQAMTWRLSDGAFPAPLSTAEGRTIHVEAGQSVRGADIVLETQGNVSGRLIWAGTKAPVQRGQLKSFDDAGDGPLAWNGAPVDSLGQWSMLGAQPGSFWLNARQTGDDRPQYTWYGQSATQAGARKMVVPESGDLLGVDIWFSDDSAVSGCVRSADGSPAVDVVATVYRLVDGQWIRIGSDVTNITGHYSVICPCRGTYTVKFTDRHGTTTSSDDSAMYLGGGESISEARRVGVKTGMSACLNVVLTPDDEARSWRAPGKTADEMALAVSQEQFVPGAAETVVIASADDVLSGVTAPALAAALDAPLLLTKRFHLAPGILAELDRLGATHVFIVGGRASVSASQETLLGALGFVIERIDGSTNSEISRNVAARAIAESSATSVTAFLVNSARVTDALMAAPVAAASGGVLLLSETTGTVVAASTATLDSAIRRVVAVGAPADITSLTLDSYRAAGAEVTRAPSGSDIYARAAAFAKYSRANGWTHDTNIGVVKASSYANGLAAGSWLGADSGVLLYTSGTAITPATALAIANACEDRRVRVFGDPRNVTTGALIQAGSALRPIKVGTPRAPSTVRASRSYIVSGTVTPRRTAGSRPVRIYKWRYVSGKWKSSGYTTASLSDASTCSIYSATVKLSTAGRWRLRAYHSADNVYGSAWSSKYSYVTSR